MESIEEPDPKVEEIIKVCSKNQNGYINKYKTL